MIQKSLIVILLLVYVVIEPTYAEDIPPIHVQNYKIDEAYKVNSDRSIMEKTWQGVCTVLGFFPTSILNGEFCVDASGLFRANVQGGDVCANGAFKVPIKFGWCNEMLTVCPNSSWVLSEDEHTINAQMKCRKAAPACKISLNEIPEEKLLAGIAYGESSTQDNFEEMAAIASAIIRRRDAAHMPSVNALVQRYKSFSYAVYDGNERYSALMCAKSELFFEKAYKAARNALNNGIDYSNGGCFWDGFDLKTSGSSHRKYIDGFSFTKPEHNIFAVEEPPPNKKTTDMGSYTHRFDSTAALGGTIFWKLNKTYLMAERAGQCL